jgi:hypothetical protein
VEAAISRQSARVISERCSGSADVDALLIKREDLLGSRTPQTVTGSKAVAELHSLRGLERVKSDVEALLALLRYLCCSNVQACLLWK